MSGVGESIVAGFMGITLLLMILLVAFGILSAVVVMLVHIPSIPLREKEMGELHFRNRKILNDWELIAFTGVITIGLSILLLILYVIGFVLIEFGWMTIE